MNWQFIFSALGIVFLLCLVFVTLFTRKKLGWVGGVRLSILMFAMIAIVTLIAALSKIFPESHPFLYNLILLVALLISVGALMYTAWQWSKFFLIFRKAGRISANISHPTYELGWIMGLVFVFLGVYAIISNRFGVMDILFICMGCLQLVTAIRSTQYRQNGVLHNGRFIPWNAIAELSWEIVRSNEIIQLHLSSTEVISIPIYFMRRKNILDFIKLKLPTQFAQANFPNLSGEIASPPSSQPIR